MASTTSKSLIAIKLPSNWRWLMTMYCLCLAGVALFTGMQEWLNYQLPALDSAFPTSTLTVAVDPTFPPFAVDTGGRYEGIDIDLANEIGARLGVDVQFVGMSFDSLYDALQEERVDVIISALLFNPAQTRDVHYTRHYFNNGLLLVTDSERPTISRSTDLPSHALALEYGSVAHGTANTWAQRLAPFTLRPYELPSYALDAVRLGDADVALVDASTLFAYQARYPNWQNHTSQVTDAFYAIGVKHERDALWRWIDVTLRDIQNDGTLGRIIETGFNRLQSE
ncbi:MAG: ABC transporter substrate-binding protein [Chloroflexota bacterium]